MADAHIAVLLPTYEPYPPFLTEALDSLLRQTEQRWSCLIHDDASSADVLAIVAPYLQDSRVTFSRNAERRGIGGNWNACLRQIPGPGTRHTRSPQPPIPSHCIQFLFQDDLWYPRYLERSLAVLEENPDVGFVASAHTYRSDEPVEMMEGYRRLEEEKKLSLAPGRHYGREFLYSWLKKGLEQNVIGEPSFVMMRRSLVEKVGMFAENLRQLLDAEYWIRCLLRTDWYYIGEELGAFRVHRESASYRHFCEEKQIDEYMRLFERFQKMFPTGARERMYFTCSLDRRFAEIVGHVVNRLMRGRGIGGGAVPVLRHFRRNPRSAWRGVRRYAVEASRRWWGKVGHWWDIEVVDRIRK